MTITICLQHHQRPQAASKTLELTETGYNALSGCFLLLF